MCKRCVWLGLMILLPVVLGGCGGAGGDAENVAPDLADTSYSSRGDPAAGAQVFDQYCAQCHTTTNEHLIGPGLAGLFSTSGPTLPAGVDYHGALPNGAPRSEPNVARWILEGGQGQISVMAPQPLNDQQLADLIAYLRTLE